MPKGEIVLGALAPHPPHVVYAENPAQNEPISEGGWETLRWGYNRLARKLESLDYDAIVVFTPHWQTYVGTHFLGLPRFSSKSVDPIFPNIFRYNYDLQVDVELSEAMCEKAAEAGLITRMMRNPDFRVDYGTITSCHMLNPKWDKPIITISSNRNTHYYSPEVMIEQALALGKACREAIEESGKRVVLVSSHSLSPAFRNRVAASRGHEQRAYLQSQPVCLGHGPDQTIQGRQDEGGHRHHARVHRADHR